MRFSAGFTARTGTALQPVADISNLTTFCLSDGIVDAQGRLYVGDIGYNFIDPAAKPVDTCVIVLVGPDGRASVVADKLFFPNGMVITPDGRTLIVGETLGHRLTAFDIQEDGSLANRRVWAQLPATVSPDGICLDAEGGVWCANPEGEDSVVRVREGGEITDRIRVAHPRLRGDAGRAGAEAPLHLCLRLPRSGGNPSKAEREPSGCRGGCSGCRNTLMQTASRHQNQTINDKTYQTQSHKPRASSPS